jgi:hypothetical protein
MTTTTTDDITPRHDAPSASSRMRFPVDEETTRSLVLLTHARVPLRRRLLRWLRRRLR